MRIAIILALVMGLAACSSAPTPPSPAALFAACGGAEDDCPPVADIQAPGCQEPVYETRQEPIWEERRTPVWGEKTVAVYQTRKVPVTISLPDACTGCDREIKLWDKEERVQVGVRRVPACIGYRVERVQVGSCPKQIRVGWRPVVEADPCAPAPVACPPAP